MTIKVKKVPWLRLLMDKFGKTFNLLMASHSSVLSEIICSMMLNFDFFRPVKHRNDYSVGVLYPANLDLPRNMHFKWENIIVVGIIPGLDKEPRSLNEFLAPLVKEIKVLWKGALNTALNLS